MGQPDFMEAVDAIVARDPRYHRDAYIFLRAALDHTQAMLEKRGETMPRHVSGGELLEGIREFCLDQFGPMAKTVLEEWGVRQCEDFGELVFNLIDQRVLSKTERDTRDDFKGGYDFETAFTAPFRPISGGVGPTCPRETVP
jgi:uncharacterized repeat protein (TIGR04138 family)